MNNLQWLQEKMKVESPFRIEMELNSSTLASPATEMYITLSDIFLMTGLEIHQFTDTTALAFNLAMIFLCKTDSNRGKLSTDIQEIKATNNQLYQVQLTSQICH